MVIPLAEHSHATTTYTYILRGPYYDNLQLATGQDAEIAFFWSNGSWDIIDLYTGGAEANVTMTSDNPATRMVWNASSVLNATRVYEFTNETSFNIRICIVSSLTPVRNYAFSVTDFTESMTNAFIQTQLVYGAYAFTVESRNLNTPNAITFVMAMYGTYRINIRCDQGTITQDFVAENQYLTTTTIPVLQFPTANVSIPTLYAERTNSSTITVTYVDPSSTTSWLYYNITHLQGATTILDYEYNNTGSTQTSYWAEADADKSYTVSATASYSGSTLSWILATSQPAPSNPFLGIFDFLGKNIGTLPSVFTGWPNGINSAQIAQLIGAAVITMFLGIGSYRNAGASCIMAWIAGGIMFALGWWNGGASQSTVSALPLFGLAGFLSILIAMHEKKEMGGGLS